MLVLLGPPFGGTDGDYRRLSELTGLVAYDLRTKLKPEHWGVVRALGDAGQAERLAAALRGAGFRCVAVDPAVGHDPARRFVTLAGLSMEDDACVLVLPGRTMAVPWRSLCSVVRGEVQVGRTAAPRSTSGSSAAFRAVIPSGVDLLQTPAPPSLEAFSAADLHFRTVPWVARIDPRLFQFPPLPLPVEGPAHAVDLLVDELARRAGVRVDRGGRTSSVLSFTARPAPRPHTPRPGEPAISVRSPPAPGGDERFDAYSRIIAEAERLLHRIERQSAPPPPG